MYRGISFEDRMDTVDFDVGERAHITVDTDICRSCTTKACVAACPAKLFEQCFECGTCYQICNNAGAISWTYPDGGHGVVFRKG